MDPLSPLFLWGDWRCTANPRFYVAECAACGGELWLHRNGVDDWRASCENGCPRHLIDAFSQALLTIQRERYQDERETRGAMDPDDPFHGIEAEVYIRLLTRREPTRGYFQCPFHGEGEERTPSLHASNAVWYCHSCHRGGSVYDFGAQLWGITPRRKGFKELQLRLAQALLGVPR